jgi:hypothetical protein
MHTHGMHEGSHDLTAKLMVVNGVTGIRDMWGDLSIGAQWLADREREVGPPRPRFVMAGHILDSSPPDRPGFLVVGTPEEGRAVVDSFSAAGSDFIKVYDGLEPQVYDAIAERAVELGLPFAGHVPQGVSAVKASDLGQASIEHAEVLIRDCWNEPDDDPWKAFPGGWSREKAAPMLRHLGENGTWYVPTLIVHRAGLAYRDHKDRPDPRLRFLPTGTVAFWASNPYLDAFSEDDWQVLRDGFSQLMDFTNLASKEGVPILAGSDNFNLFTLPGFGLHDELALLVEAGLSELQALQAATINPARFLQAEDSLGTVEVGKMADLVLLGGNPLEDIKNSTKIEAVILNGRLLDRVDLDALLAELESEARAGN